MSNPGEGNLTPITSTRQLAEYLATGCKPREKFRIGTEHEKFGFRLSDLMPPPYEPQGIRATLEGIAADRLGADHRPGQADRADPQRRLHLAGAGRPVRAVGRASPEPARDPCRDSTRI